ncbi:protein translocase subunit SecDF [Limibacter armeniacum]|uniref:protein translocase subunit SecDF n=1 Tax=Limibacter armeniacum TaxID=466084 RepID=UPI002FE5003C
MKNRGGIILLAVIVTAFCLFDLSFTYVSRQINNDAEAYATDSEGHFNYFKKQSYVDSLWNEPVYNFLGVKEYTLREVKEKELALGLDLQGGMHVILEVSPTDIVKTLAGNNVDKAFETALENAVKEQRNSQDNFTDLFFNELDAQAPGKSYAEYFATAANKGKVSFNSSNTEVKRVIEAEVNDAVDRAFQIVRTRIDQFGVTQPNIQKIQGTSRIQIELPGVDSPERVRKLLQGVAKLEFMEVWTPQEATQHLVRLNDTWVKKHKAEETLAPKTEEKVEEKKGSESDLFEGAEGDSATVAEADSAKTEETAVSPLFEYAKGGLIYSLEDTAKVNEMLRDPQVKELIPSDLEFAWENKGFEAGEGQELIRLYTLKRGRKSGLTGDAIADARQSFDQNGRPAISMSMNVEGAKKWKRITASNLGNPIAIVLDNRVYSAPTVQSEIGDGRSEITGNFTAEEAKDLANILKAGKLPAPTRIVEEVVVGPSLGEVAQNQGLTSIVVGLALVVLFMIAYYSKGGLIADLALVANIFFIFGILAELGAALTLPGIAGIVLTIGMSIDANVLIFERVREEMRKGLPLVDAVKTGYDRAFWTIFDANLTTLLTGFMLYTFGTGPIKGFAVTLMIGIVCSFFSAVFLTKEVVAYLVAKKGNDAKLSFSSPISSKVKDLNFDFIKGRKIAYIISIVTIVAGAAVMATNGLNLGVDFKGGRSYIVQFSQEVTPSKLEGTLDKALKSADVKTYGSEDVLKITTAYLIDEESAEADAEVKDALVKAIESHTGDKFSNAKNASEGTFIISSSSKVGATIADDIAKGAEEAVVFSLLAIFFYVWVRFSNWQFGLGAVAALFHDVLIVIAIFAIATLLGAPFEVDQVFVAAILTIVGYSINDTVVVFDHVREHLAENKGTSLKDTFNKAINNTLNRTLITSLTTLLVIVILLIFGGEVLRGFSFSMMVGILVGTYSSVFIASSIVYDTNKKFNVKTGDKKESANA